MDSFQDGEVRDISAKKTRPALGLLSVLLRAVDSESGERMSLQSDAPIRPVQLVTLRAGRPVRMRISRRVN
jgi:hypothetical protein